MQEGNEHTVYPQESTRYIYLCWNHTNSILPNIQSTTPKPPLRFSATSLTAAKPKILVVAQPVFAVLFVLSFASVP